MKRLSLIVVAATLTLTFSLAAYAQTAAPAELIANIPFKFHVGEKTMPAGTYRIRCINTSSDARVLQLRSADGRSSAVVQTTNVIGKLQDDARLVFRRYGNSYYFAEAWLASDTTGLALRKSAHEKAEEQFAATRPKRETIVLARAR